MTDETPPTLPLSDGGSDGDHDAGTYGRFQSLGVIGRGGMGVVLRARDPELGRDVAIKVLAPGSAAPLDRAASERLQREAQAMARLSHPNVVTVYEIGQVGEARFIAMELVEGVTLRRWLAQRERPWREIVVAFIACGRGLAAAHSAGLVHRDFKPDNVLIGADGRPRVTDFGLVTGTEPVAEVDAEAAPPSAELSVRGALVGTPMYMAPEQWRGLEVDGRTDQFAFCVSLWEALHGARPFAGTSSVELRERVLAGDITAPPSGARAHRRIDAILRRGLARSLDARWPSMDALLDALERTLRRRWPWAAGALAVGGAIAATALVMRPAAVDPCPDPEARLAGIWDGPTRERIIARFREVSPALADEIGARVVVALDAYAFVWRGEVVAACRATRLEGTQSEPVLDRRMMCLDRRRHALGALTTALVHADRDRILGAIEAVDNLGDLEQCKQVESMLAFPAPSEPARRARVDALEAELREIAAMRFGGVPAERLRRATAAVENARALAYPPHLVEALKQQFAAADTAEDYAVHEAALRELATAGAEAKDDAAIALAWTSLFKLLARRGRADEALALEPVAEAAVARAGVPELRYTLRSAIAIRKAYAQELDASIALLESLRADAGPVQLPDLTRTLAQVRTQRDGPAAGLPLAEESLATAERGYGAEHPKTAEAHHLIAQLSAMSGDLDRAQASEARAVAIREQVFGADHLLVAQSRVTLGNIAVKRKDRAAARAAFEQALPVLDRAGDGEGAGMARGALADVVADLDGLDAARPLFVAALEQLGKATGRDKPIYAMLALAFAEQLFEHGACDEARPWFATAEAILAAKRPQLIADARKLAGACRPR